MPGRLNSFQRTMLQWNDLHPYNAVHVARIPGELDSDALRGAINGVLEAYGTGALLIDPRKGTFEHRVAASRCDIKRVAAGDDFHESLRAEIERQLNAPFPAEGSFNPFRFFVAPDRDSFSLGLAYFHAAADAVSIVCLMKAIIAAYRNKTAAFSPGRIVIHPRCYDSLLLRHPILLARKLSAICSTTANLRQSVRPPYHESRGQHNACDFFPLDRRTLPALAATAKSWGVTLNDLFLAVLLKIVSPVALRQARSGKRRRISVGCIVNLRSDLGMESARTFGLFLGSFVITHEVPEGIGLRQLAVDVRRQTLANKKHRLYLGTSLEMNFARLMLSFFSTRRRQKLYQKHYPLWGGITNMNLDSLWQQAGEKPVDYFRAVSTGPVTPLVLSISTINDVLTASITSRANALSAADVGLVKQSFLESLNGMEVSA